MIIGGYMDGFGSQKKILEIIANSWGGLGVVDWQELDQELQNPRYGHVVIPVCEGITTCQWFGLISYHTCLKI